MKLLSLSTQDGGNVLTKEHLLEHLRAWRVATNQTVEAKGLMYKFTDVCDSVSERSTECRVSNGRVLAPCGGNRRPATYYANIR